MNTLLEGSRLQAVNCPVLNGNSDVTNRNQKWNWQLFPLQWSALESQYITLIYLADAFIQRTFKATKETINK